MCELCHATLASVHLEAAGWRLCLPTFWQCSRDCTHRSLDLKIWLHCSFCLILGHESCRRAALDLKSCSEWRRGGVPRAYDMTHSQQGQSGAEYRPTTLPKG